MAQTSTGFVEPEVGLLCGFDVGLGLCADAGRLLGGAKAPDVAPDVAPGVAAADSLGPVLSTFGCTVLAAGLAATAACFPELWQPAINPASTTVVPTMTNTLDRDNVTSSDQL